MKFCVFAAVWLTAPLLWAQSGGCPNEGAVALFYQAREAATPQQKIPLLKKSLELQKCFEAAWALGNAYMDLADYPNAQNAFRTGLEMTPEAHPKARAAFMIGLAAEKQGQLLQAAEYLKASLSYEVKPDVEKALARVEVAQSRTVLPASEISKAFLVSKAFEVTEDEPAAPGGPAKPPTLARIDLRVNFSLDRADLTNSGREQADELGKALLQTDLSAGKIVLIGHTDRRGTDQHNDGLSLNRAETIRNYLTTHFTGIDPQRLACEGRGKRKLLAQGNSEDDHAINRRVEVRLVAN